MESVYYVGIDIDDKFAVASVFYTGMKEPETVSMVAGSEVFQIPVTLTKKQGLGQWFIGDEAKRVAMVQNIEPIDFLLSKALNRESIFIEDEKYQAVELLTLYIKKLIFLTGKLGNPGLPDKLIFTLESLSREITGLFFEIGAKLGIDKCRIMLLDRKEGFYYYTLNQKQELWNHDVFLFDYRDENISCCHMKRNTKTVPQMITLDAKQRYMSKAGCDDSFYRILQDCFAGHSISSVYLVGDGFEGDWMKVSLAYLCKGRRAFVGKNLYSKGACYAAMVADAVIEWPYIYIGDNEMKVNISLKVKKPGGMEFLTLISAGDNLYETEATCEVILEGTPEVDFWLQLPHSRDAKIQKLELSDLPEREDKTTRLRIHVKPLSDTEVSIKIRDLGFGEIVKSTDKVWEYVMLL